MEPIITASVIAGLVIGKVIEKMTEKTVDTTYEGLKSLKEKIERQFQDNPKALACLNKVIESKNTAQNQEKLTRYLDLEMMEDLTFADEICKLAQPILTSQTKTNAGVQVGSQTAG